MTHPAYGQLRAVTDTASVLMADNPRLLTLDGHQHWVLRGPLSDELVVVDPGGRRRAPSTGLPRSAAPRVGMLISHRHGDHTSIIKLVRARKRYRAADLQFFAT